MSGWRPDGEGNDDNGRTGLADAAWGNNDDEWMEGDDEDRGSAGQPENGGWEGSGRGRRKNQEKKTHLEMIGSSEGDK